MNQAEIRFVQVNCIDCSKLIDIPQKYDISKSDWVYLRLPICYECEIKRDRESEKDGVNN